jgi:hypothetical protein
MGEAARVDSIDVIKEFKAALWKFQEAATVSLGDAESEIQRVLLSLQTEQDSYWQHQIRKREEIVSRAKEAVRMKKVFKDSTGRQQSAIDEEKALKIALKQLEEAQQKLTMVRKWARILPKEIEMYKGSVQRFATTVQSQLPAAAGRLDKLSSQLEAYVALQAQGAADALAASPAPSASAPSMRRGGMGPQGFPQTELQRLLGLLPGPEIRAAAPVLAELQLRAPFIPPPHRSPAMLPVTRRRDPASGSRVFIAKGASDAVRIFVHHAESTSSQDSGWIILPVDEGLSMEFEAIRAAALIQARPDLVDLLGLPVGFSVIIDSGGISEVFDSRNRPAWRRPLESP